MKECNFSEIIKNINSLDYTTGSSTQFKFLIKNKNTVYGKAIIDSREHLRVYANGKLVWYIDPDWMELYNTIRKITLLFNCTDNTKYFILKF